MTRLLAYTLLTATALAADPIAPHKYVEVSTAGSDVIRLSGYDLDGDSLTVTIESLPTTGTLYQLSQVYSDYGYDPKIGTEITATGTVLTGSKNRLVYSRPSSDSVVYGKWDEFTYTVSDGSASSEEGIVSLVGSNHLLEGSDFSADADDWLIVDNKEDSSSATYEASSRGIMNHYIYGTDDNLHIDSSSGDDQKLWKFEAPAAFLGHHGAAYGGEFHFAMSSFSGDFSTSNLNSDAHLVELVCDQCDVNAGITLAFPLASTDQGTFDGSATEFVISLDESAGWLLDSKNTLVDWSAPTQCEMIEVLSGLSAVRILGDFTRWYESVSLDSVSFQNTAASVPICANSVTDASTCTC